jgi:hypothetical protein
MAIGPKEVRSRGEFVEFVHGLLAELQSAPDTWENPTLDRFLEALAAWTADMDGYCQNHGLAMPPDIVWQWTANMLHAATLYE